MSGGLTNIILAQVENVFPSHKQNEGKDGGDLVRGFGEEMMSWRDWGGPKKGC